MALQDILTAIQAQAQQDAERIQEQAVREKDVMRRRTDDDIATFEKDLDVQVSEKKRSMTKRTHTMADMERKSQVLRQKRSLMDAVYQELLEKLRTAPQEKIGRLLDSCLSSLHGKKGQIRPAKAHASMIPGLPHFDSKHFSLGEHIDAAGGFIFASDIAEEDFTFERLIADNVRSQKEPEVASLLFS
jgi:vacuolar-type H+-ATPase subunit E/Vma4